MASLKRVIAFHAEIAAKDRQILDLRGELARLRFEFRLALEVISDAQLQEKFDALAAPQRPAVAASSSPPAAARTTKPRGAPRARADDRAPSPPSSPSGARAVPA